MALYRAGVDVGSTTVKLVLLDGEDHLIYGDYRRHGARIQDALRQLLGAARRALGEFAMRARITGSGAIALGKALGIAFAQEVTCVADALLRRAPGTDVAIELGGEDAKILYLTGGLEERMNGVCAGGTGAFIDQMAALLQTDAAGLDALAARAGRIYPIAARCGVFAKTDIQPLINEGAAREDLAASIFQAVVNQTISGLACGKPIRGRVAFLGGPLHFLPQLKAAFIRTLKLTDETAIDPPDSHLFAAMGAALKVTEEDPVFTASGLDEQLAGGVRLSIEMPRLEPLFADEAEYEAFCRRHERAVVPRGELAGYAGPCYLGLDAGSTTTKLALIGQQGELLYSFYANNNGDPIGTAKRAVQELNERLAPGAYIAWSCSTGYGEGLLKSAFSLDEGEVETIAHCTAAAFFRPDADCVLDIGGQDMKCIRLRNGAVDSVVLNEACSSGCGSFLENFAASLGMTAEEFGRRALFARAPVDLGTRCTVFMNSNVKQAQKEGVDVADISAGLACSVIKNALFKVIKLGSADELGAHVVVQGGTFHNRAVLRAFEKIAGTEAVCPDIAGLMGAFGAALIARDRCRGRRSGMLPLEEIASLTWKSAVTRCQSCANHCTLTVSTFPGGRRHVTGNRCEKGLGAENAVGKGPNMFAYKRERMFRCPVRAEEDAPRGTIGLPRTLNMYENYPFWGTFFYELGFRTVLSPFSDRKLYERGMESIPSESECYPAKLSHGHIEWLIDRGVRTIFHPCVYYEYQETEGAQNHFNCPIVVSYPENLKNNVETLSERKIRYLRPFLAFTSERTAADRLVELCREEWGIPARQTRRAVRAAWAEQRRAKRDVREEGTRLLARMEREGGRGIVLAGRPYHVDPEINHGIPEMIASYGLYVFTEDSLPLRADSPRPLRVVDQWVYHSRLYSAAELVRERDDLELVQLVSFGCGLDAVTSDQVSEILEGSNKLYTMLKIDEVNNLGAVRIRVRSLMAAMELRRRRGIAARPAPMTRPRRPFTRAMRREGYTILAPQMSPIHFDLLEPIMRRHGYRLVILDNDNRSAIDTGLKYVNNDACYPSITVVGQLMQAVLSGRYDTDRLALMMTQTGGCCRASNYVAFIRRALEKAGLGHIPVISLNLNGMEKNPGFALTPKLGFDLVRGAICGDLLMRCLYRTRPYERVPGSADALHAKWRDACVDALTGRKRVPFGTLCREIVADFDALPLEESIRKPRVGIVGEILVKYMPLANNGLVRLLEREGAEAVVPDLMDFLNYCLYNARYKVRYEGGKRSLAVLSGLGIRAVAALRAPAVRALEKSRRFDAPLPIARIAEMTRPFLSLGNQYGEGWLLTGEMIELIRSGTPNIVCIQPFGCLPNHVVGKGVIKSLRRAFPQANIAAVDYDPGTSEVNQLNRIKLMLAAAAQRQDPTLNDRPGRSASNDFPAQRPDLTRNSVASPV